MLECDGGEKGTGCIFKIDSKGRAGSSFLLSRALAFKVASAQTTSKGLFVHRTAVRLFVLASEQLDSSFVIGKTRHFPCISTSVVRLHVVEKGGRKELNTGATLTAIL